ncbi:MAG: hypothetical protein R3253_01680 [Longimicrobiales bacterium]|nr:hypothetical protein [Longimicrobiales bacterium]
MRAWTAGSMGVVAGVLLLAGFRYMTASPPPITHHHANWAVFVAGERLDLSADRFMEDVSACRTSPDAIRPQDRIHLHDGNPDVVHVHHPASTWGQLLANLGMAAGPDYLFTPDGAKHLAGGDSAVVFIRNGQRVYDLSNEPVRSLDRVAIAFGAQEPDEVMSDLFPQVADNAAEHNDRADPGACMGSHEPESFSARLRRAFIG